MTNETLDKFGLYGVSSSLRGVKMSTNDSEWSSYSSKAQLLALNSVCLHLDVIAIWSDKETTGWKDDGWKDDDSALWVGDHDKRMGKVIKLLWGCETLNS